MLVLRLVSLFLTRVDVERFFDRGSFNDVMETNTDLNGYSFSAQKRIIINSSGTFMQL